MKLRHSSRVWLWLLLASAVMGCRPPPAAEAIGAQPPKPKVVKPVEVDRSFGDAQRMLGPAEQAGRREGATSLEVIALGAASEGSHLGSFITVAPDICLVALARATDEITDLDVLVFDDAGTTLAADERVGPHAGVVLCPPHAGRMYVAARVASGQGLVAVGAQTAHPARAADVAAALDAVYGPQSREMQEQAWPGLDARIAAHRTELGGQWEDLRKVSMPITPRVASFISVALPAARCLDVLVIPSEETGQLEVTLSDDRGSVLARGTSVGAARTALLCTLSDATISVSVRPHHGHGQAAVVLARSAPGQVRELAKRPDARLTGPMLPIGAVSQRLELALGGFAAPYRRGGGRLEMAKDTSVPVELGPGCSRIDVLVGEPLSAVRAVLWEPDDRVLASAEGGGHAVLFGCQPLNAAGIQAMLELHGVGRPGPFAFALRREPSVPKELARHPVAAGRMMGRLNEAGRVVRARDVTAHELDLDEESRASFPVEVPIGTCVDVVMALGRGASGLQLRLVDASSGEELGSGLGLHEVLMPVCSGDKARKLRVVGQVSAGRTTALGGVVTTAVAGP